MATKKQDTQTAVHNPHTNTPPAGIPSGASVAEAAQTIAAQFDGTIAIAQPAAAPSRFQELVSRADIVQGNTLERNKDNLVGVPFVITGVTARDGIRSARTGLITNYLSLEGIIADKAFLDKLIGLGRLDANVYDMWIPEEAIVFNDGSTGVCRQVISYLHENGYIEVPDGPEGGAMGESRWDLYRGEWLKGINDANDEPVFDLYGKPLFAPRGLRKSTYANDWSPDGTTFYFG